MLLLCHAPPTERVLAPPTNSTPHQYPASQLSALQETIGMFIAKQALDCLGPDPGAPGLSDGLGYSKWMSILFLMFRLLPVDQHLFDTLTMGWDVQLNDLHLAGR